MIIFRSKHMVSLFVVVIFLPRRLCFCLFVRNVATFFQSTLNFNTLTCHFRKALTYFFQVSEGVESIIICFVMIHIATWSIQANPITTAYAYSKYWTCCTFVHIYQKQILFWCHFNESTVHGWRSILIWIQCQINKVKKEEQKKNKLTLGHFFSRGIYGQMLHRRMTSKNVIHKFSFLLKRYQQYQ